MPTGVYERKPRKATTAKTEQTPKATKASKRTHRPTAPVATVVEPLPVDPNQTTTEWQELRYNEILEHPTWMKSTEHLAKRNLQMAKAKRIRRRVITRSKWEVIE